MLTLLSFSSAVPFLKYPTFINHRRLTLPCFHIAAGLGDEFEEEEVIMSETWPSSVPNRLAGDQASNESINCPVSVRRSLFHYP